MTYRVFHDGEPAEEVEVEYAWWVLDQDRLKAEPAEHGLHLTPTGPADLGLWCITTSPR